MRIPLTLLRRRPAPAPETAAPTPPPSPFERARGVRVDLPTRALYQAISLLLDYPGEELVARIPLLRATLEQSEAAGVPSAARVRPLLDRLETTPLAELQSDYVETFDMRRRCCLHLTYYAFGDTRRRGMALLDLKQAYLASGVDLSDAELPDHLCVLLEFTASVEPAVGRVLLQDNRPGIELLRLSLADRGSPYAAAVEALTGTFPAIGGSDAQAVRALVAQGPPDEEVGMEAFMSGSSASQVGARS